MIKAIFFDTSDTLYKNKDFENAQSAQPIKQLAELRDFSEDEAKKLFQSKKQELELTLDHVTKVSVMMELGITRLQMQKYMSLVDAKDFLNKDQDLNILILDLSKQYKLGIISNILKKSVYRVLEALAVPTDYFEYYVTVDNTSKSKPDIEPFKKAIELSGFKPSEIIYVGDSLSKDIKPAKKCGLRTIWINNNDETDTKYADETVDSIYKIPFAISKLNK